MKEVPKGRSTRMALPSATSTWRRAAKQEHAPVQISAGHLEKEQQLENALDEYCVLREQDRSLTVSRFCDRYPSYRLSLRRLIDVYDAMEGQPTLDDENWPELFSEFLGYQILHELGVGAIARVYLATEAALGGRLVAIKVAQEGGYEAETLGKLTHPNIVPVFSVKHDEETDMTAVCMPYHGSATLADLLEIGFQHGAPPTSARVILDAAREREQIVDFVESVSDSRHIDLVLSRGNYVDAVVRLGIQMAEALAYTHERGILHRDLKPSNVLLTPDGVPMLLDFNLASDIAAGAQRLGGTLPYMPPEQIRDVHLQPFEAELAGDPRSDIFSLGVILYELLTGKLPFGDPPACAAPRQAAEEFLAAQQQVPRSVRDLNPTVSSELARLLHNCLALEPSQRPASAADLVGELKKYFSPRRRVRRWTSCHRGLVATFVLLFLSTASTAIWHVATRPPFDIRQYIAGADDFHRERLQDALEHFSAALKVNPDSDAYLTAHGVTKLRLGAHQDAYSDLKRIKKLDDPLVLECVAYSAAQTPGADVIARTHYRRLCESTPQSATLRLNQAYSYFLAPHYEMSGQAANQAKQAIAIRPNWRPAYHFLAIANRNRAILAERKIQGSRDRTRIDFETDACQRAIEDAIQFIDIALELGDDDALIVRDAIKIHSTIGPEVDTPRLRELFEKAIRCGLPRQEIQSLGGKVPWRDSAWFASVLKRSQVGERIPSPSLAEQFLTPPDYHSVEFLLAVDPRE